MLTYFNESVPMNIRKKINLYIEEIGRNSISNLGGQGRDCFGECNIGNIIGNPESGYIPFQLGGNYAEIFYSNGHCSGSYFTPKAREFTERQYSEIINSFSEEHLNGDRVIFDELSDDLQETLIDAENEYLNPILLKIALFVNRDFQVELRVTINYFSPHYQPEREEIMKRKVYGLNQFLKTPFYDFEDYLKS